MLSSVRGMKRRWSSTHGIFCPITATIYIYVHPPFLLKDPHKKDRLIIMTQNILLFTTNVYFSLFETIAYLYNHSVINDSIVIRHILGSSDLFCTEFEPYYPYLIHYNSLLLIW